MLIFALECLLQISCWKKMIIVIAIEIKIINSYNNNKDKKNNTIMTKVANLTSPLRLKFENRNNRK